MPDKCGLLSLLYISADEWSTDELRDVQCFLPSRGVGIAAVLAGSQEESLPPAPGQLSRRLFLGRWGQASASRGSSALQEQVLGPAWSSPSLPGNTHQPREPVPSAQPAARSLLFSLCPVTFSLTQEFAVRCRVREMRRHRGELSFRVASRGSLEDGTFFSLNLSFPICFLTKGMG